MPDRNDLAELDAFTRSIAQLVRRIRVETPAGVRHLSMTQRSVLALLDEEGPLTSADLARAEGITPQSMSTAVAPLLEQGLVERKPHPSDGRQQFLVLSARGKALRRSTRAAKQHWLNVALAKLERDERALLVRAGQIIQRMVEDS